MIAEIKSLSSEEIARLSPDNFDLAPIFVDMPFYTPPTGRVLLVRDGETPIAVAALKHPSPDTVEIGNFTIHPRYRGRGLGGKLMRAVLAEAKTMGAQKLTALTEPYCPEWRAFYQAHGFTYENPTDESATTGLVRVTKKLNGPQYSSPTP